MLLYSSSFPVVLKEKALGSEHPFMDPQGCPGHIRSVSQVGMFTAPDCRHSLTPRHPPGSQGAEPWTFHTVFLEPANPKRDQVFASISELDWSQPRNSIFRPLRPLAFIKLQALFAC